MAEGRDDKVEEGDEGWIEAAIPAIGRTNRHPMSVLIRHCLLRAVVARQLVIHLRFMIILIGH